MAKVTLLDIDPSVEDLMLKGVNVKDRASVVNIEKKDILWRKRNLKEVESRSFLSLLTDLWNGLTTIQKTDWQTAGSSCGLTGYNLFVLDTSYRIQNCLSGVATPNDSYQYLVMKLNATVATKSYGGTQFHFDSYQIKQYRSGSKRAFDWVTIEEIFAPPLLVEFDYTADLTSGVTFPFFYVRGYFSGEKSGAPSSDTVLFDLDISSGWQRFSENFNPDLDEIDYYYIKIYCYGYTGLAYFDNFNFEHDGQNFAIDPSCNSVYEKLILHNNYYSLSWEYGYVDDTGHVTSFYLDI